MKKILFAILLFVASSQAFSQVPAATADFFKLIDLTRPDMKSISALVSASKYDAALEVWRDTVVNRLRRLNLGQFNWHSNCQNGYYINFSKMLVENMTPSAYTSGSTSYDDYYGITNSPYKTPKDVNWMANPPSGVSDNDGDIASWMMFVTLPATYHKMFDTIYLKKYMQVSSDFSVRQKTLLKALSAADQKLHSPNYSLGAQEVLWQGDRVANIVKCLGVLAKNLPGESKISAWDGVISTVRAKVTTQNTKCISAKQLSNIAAALVADNPDVLLSVYRYAGKVPNQRFNGLYSLMMMCVAFPEFKSVAAVESETVAGLTDYMKTMCAKDGGFLEQSFNYNQTDAGKMSDLVDLAASAGRSSMPIVALLSNGVDDFYRLLWALKTPLMAQPLVGNCAHSGAPNVWTSTTVADTYKKTIAASSDVLSKQIVNAFNGKTPAPNFTSISFPYSGYYTQRQGWKIDDAYLFFMAGRAARGHKMGDNNSIQVVAFGRELIATDGPPDYYGDLTTQGGYISEGSSLKANTVIVDGKSQFKNNYLNAQASTPIASRFYNSSTEDFVEGTFDKGYAAINGTAATVTDVTHNRQVIFVKEAGIWIMTDFMTNSGTASHTYSQVWNFEPYLTASKIYGFTEAQVNFDKTNKRIVTSDPSGPNIRLQNFGKISTLDYVKYYNQASPAMGWYAPSISTITPAVDIHANWSGTGNQALGTIIMPSKGSTADVVYKDLSPDVKTAALSLTLPNGNKLMYSSGFTAKKTTQFNFTFNSKGYLLQENANGDVTGMVIGGDKAALLWDGNSIDHGFSDYGIQYDVAMQTITLTPFEVPNTFVWDSKPVASILSPAQADVVFVISTTSAKAVIKEGVVVYPNPSNGAFFLSSADDVKQVKMYNLQGKEMLSVQNVNGGFGENLAEGMYILQVEYMNGNIFYNKVEKF
ncbi:MAG: heparinase II/III family protein [Bacteroidetes bacterium]|nr:heparinase II/III family protein [Bacteroidota bacterium]